MYKFGKEDRLLAMRRQVNQLESQRSWIESASDALERKAIEDDARRVADREAAIKAVIEALEAQKNLSSR